jgi:hypothetical protein
MNKTYFRLASAMCILSSLFIMYQAFSFGVERVFKGELAVPLVHIGTFFIVVILVSLSIWFEYKAKQAKQ